MNKLKEIRAVKRITQFQLRISTGIHQSKISLMENGLIFPREDERKKIAKALGVMPADIWNEDGERVNKNRKEVIHG